MVLQRDSDGMAKMKMTRTELVFRSPALRTDVTEAWMLKRLQLRTCKVLKVHTIKF